MKNIHSETIEKIYDAAVKQSEWQFAIDNLVRQMGASSGALLVRELGSAPYSVNALSSAYLNMIQSGKAQYYLENLSRYEAVQWDFIGRMKIGEIERDENMGVEKEVLDQREDYIFLKENAGMQRRLAFRLNENRGWFDGMTIGFPPHVGRISGAKIAELSLFLPHLAKSVELSRTFRILQERYGAVLAVLDKVKIGLFLSLENGEIIVANSEAQRILALQDGLTLTSGNQLLLRDSDQSAQLKSQISEIAQTAKGEADTAQHVLQLQRPSLAHPFLVEVAPVRDSNNELDTGISGALVIVVDPENSDELNATVFGSLYGLTKAETEVCDLLIRGFQTGEISDIRGTVFSTAKNQIAAIYLKTGNRRRGDLIRLVIKTLPPIV